MSSRLSTTSYAILGLLAIRPWTPYEMTRQMRRSLGRFWPRAQSKLYEEPKKLVEHGLATAANEHRSGRPRTRYEITEAGRRALSTWLGTRPQLPTLEAEPLLRIFFAEHGDRASLVRVLEETHEWASAKLLDDARIARGYLGGQEGPFPDRIAQLTLVGRFLSDFALMTHDWSRWALRTVQTWPASIQDAEADRQALAEIAARADRVDRADRIDGVEPRTPEAP